MTDNTEKTIRDYYDQNTRRFLWLGGSRKSLTIHRAVWGPGVTRRAEALEYTNRLVLEQAEETARRFTPGQPFHALDLGCGVGGSLIYLARHFQGHLRGSGVTLSPLQARLAAEAANRLGLSGQCAFYEASYLALPALPPADLAFAIESFILGPDPAKFFASASAALRPGGRLVIIDDLCSPLAEQSKLSGRQKAWLDEFQSGWHAVSLISATQAAQLARGAGLSLCLERNLTPLLRFRTARDRVVALAAGLGRLLPLWRLFGKEYWRSLNGGHALQKCLEGGIVEYRLLVFEKETRK